MPQMFRVCKASNWPQQSRHSVYNGWSFGVLPVFLFLSILQASAGYGDVMGTFPSWEERDVHIWTNIVRVDPEEFFGLENDWLTPCDGRLRARRIRSQTPALL